MKSHFATILLSLTTLPSLLLVLAPVALADTPLTTTDKASQLLRCLGKGPSARAVRTAVEALIDANPNPSTDDSVWLQLGPKEWGFKGHTQPGGDTWTPVDGAAATIKDKVARQHDKLLGCVRKMQGKVTGGVVGDAGGVAKDFVNDAGVGKVQKRKSTVNGNPVVAMNDAEEVAPGGATQPAPSAGNGQPTPGTTAANGDQKTSATTPAPVNGQPAPGTSAPGTPAPAGGKPAPDTTAPTDPTSPKPANGQPVTPKPDQGAGTTAAKPAGGNPTNPGTTDPKNPQKTAPGATAPGTTAPGTTIPGTDAKKLPPGVGNDEKSVAPELENDPMASSSPRLLRCWHWCR